MTQKDYYLDIRNGDIAYSTDADGHFLGADYIKCGEWFTYKTDELNEFIELLDYYGFAANADELRRDNNELR